MASRRGAFHQFEHLLKRFEIDSPVTKQQLKHAYLKRVKQWHPDVNKSPDAKQKFVQLQDEYHKLEKYISNRQFLGEWEQFKKGIRSTSSLDYDEGPSSTTPPPWQQQPRRGSPFRHADGSESAGPSGNEKYHYYHSGPFTRPQSRNLDDDPFEQYRQFYQEQTRNSPGTQWRYKRWKHFHQVPFFLSPQFVFFLTFVLPLALFANFNRRRTERYNEIDDNRWIISREIKSHLWEELKRSNLANRPLSTPTSFLLLSIDNDRAPLIPSTGQSAPHRIAGDAHQNDLTTFATPTLDEHSMIPRGSQSSHEHRASSSSDDNMQIESSRSDQPSRSDRPRPRRRGWDGSEEGLYFHVDGSQPVKTPSEMVKMSQEMEAKKAGGGKRRKHDAMPAQDSYYYTRRDKLNQLHRAVIKRDFDQCLYLLLGGLYSGYPDRKHRTALHYAAYSGQTDLCRLLLLFNANPLALDGFQETPIDAARQAGWKDVERVLVFAASGSYKLALDLSYNHDPRLRYSQLFASTMAAILGSYIPPDIAYHMGRLRGFSFR